MLRFRWIALAVALLLLATSPVSAQNTPTPNPVTYTVHNGDTLGSIASRYHTTVGEIMRLNNLTNPQLIVIGQSLHLPSGQAVPEATSTTEALDSLPLFPPQTPGVTAEPAAPAFDYGVEAFFDNQDVNTVTQQITALGMHWAKVRAAWRDLETSKGNTDYSHLDAIIDALQASNLNILLTVTDAPDWARISHVENGPPDNFDDYTAFISALAAHYAGRVRAYEIWNEPNLRREWNSTTHAISADSYADLLRGAYAAVKAADPAATVVSAGLAPTGFNDGVNALDDRQYLARLYALGLASMTVAVGAHPFGFGNPPDSVCCAAPAGVLTHFGHPSFYFLDTLNDYHQLMTVNGDANKMIWVTEFGWGTSEDAAAPPDNSRFVSYNTLAQQAQYLSHAFEIGASSGFVGMMILYNLNSCMVQPDNAEACYYSLIAPSGQPRPAYNTLRMVFAPAGNH